MTANATPGAATGTTTGSSTGSSTSSAATSGSTAKRARELAERAAAQSAAAHAAAGGTTSTGSTGTTGSTGSTGSAAAPTAAARRAAALRAVAGRPARISLRLKTASGSSTRSKRGVGLLVPSPTKTVARIVGISKSNQVVTLRLREGAALTGKQSKGTRCTKRLSSGDCQLVRVRTGRTAVIRAPESASGRPGAVTALRVTAIWRGGYKVAG